MFNEYKFFRQQSKQLIELQEDYRNYINVLRRVFDLHKTDNQEVESIIEEKKKPFIVINREKSYLKQSMLDFLREKKMGNAFNAFNSSYFSKDFQEKPNHTISSKKKFQRTSKLRKSFLRNRIFDKDAVNLFIWPINNKDFWISSFFGLRKMKKGYSFHYGIDMAAIKGTMVKAAASGQVLEASYSLGYGNTIVLKHNSKYKTRYAHLNTIDVKIGQQVEKGSKIGTVGDTGSVRSYGKNRDASHLHFEIYEFGKQINPLYVLQ